MVEQCRSLRKTDPAAYDLRRRFSLRTCNSKKIVQAALPHFSYAAKRGTSNPATAKCMTARNRLLATVAWLVKSREPRARCVKDAIRTYLALGKAGFKAEMVLRKNSRTEEYEITRNHIAKYHMFVRVADPDRPQKHIFVSLGEGGVIDRPAGKLDAVPPQRAIALAELSTANSYEDAHDAVQELAKKQSRTPLGALLQGILKPTLKLCALLFTAAARYHHDVSVRYDPPKGDYFAPIYFNAARFSWWTDRDMAKAWRLNQLALKRDPQYRMARTLKVDLVRAKQ